MKLFRKIGIGIGSALVLAIPVITVVSCNASTTDQQTISARFVSQESISLEKANDSIGDFVTELDSSENNDQIVKLANDIKNSEGDKKIRISIQYKDAIVETDVQIKNIDKAKPTVTVNKVYVTKKENNDEIKMHKIKISDFKAFTKEFLVNYIKVAKELENINTADDIRNALANDHGSQT